MPDDTEETTAEEAPTRSRKTSPVVSPPTEFDIEELISKSHRIAEVEPHMAAGAVKHAGIDRKGKMIVEDFKKICKDFLSVKAF